MFKLKKYLPLLLLLLVLPACETTVETPVETPSEAVSYESLPVGILNHSEDELRMKFFFGEVPVLATKHIDVTEGDFPDEYFNLYLPSGSSSLMVEVTSLRSGDEENVILTESFDLTGILESTDELRVIYDGTTLSFSVLREEPDVIGEIEDKSLFF